MLDSSLLKTAVDTMQDTLQWAIKQIGLGDQRSIADLNKEAAKNSLTLYGLNSSNVDTKYLKAVSFTIEYKIAFLCSQIISNIIMEDPLKARDFILRNFSNHSEEHNSGTALGQNVMDSLREQVGSFADNIEFNIGLSEATKKPVKIKQGMDIAKDVMGYDPRKNGGTGIGYEAKSDQRNKNCFTSPGSSHTFSITSMSKKGDKFTFNITIMVRVNLLEIPTEKLLDAMASSKNHSLFDSYLNYRAGLIPFFKGFIMNLNEIKKQVDRETSNSIPERILANLIRKSGFLVPKIISDVMEFKNYLLILTSDDVDALSRNFNINLTKPSDLHKVFANLNILSIIIIDEAKQRITLMDSDRPTMMQIVSIADLENEKRLQQIFSTIGRV